MVSDADYAMGMAQVLATLAVAVAIIARRTVTRPLQAAQTALHFVAGFFGLGILVLDVMVASNLSPQFLIGPLRKLNLIAVGALLLLIFALAPFFQTKGETLLEAEAQEIVRKPAGGKAGNRPPSGPRSKRKQGRRR